MPSLLELNTIKCTNENRAHINLMWQNNKVNNMDSEKKKKKKAQGPVIKITMH